MHRGITVLVLCGAASLFAPAPASAITIDWSPVNQPGNAADPSTGFGAVNYSYNIGTYDVTNAQYVAFLNSNDPTGANPVGLYNTDMSNLSFGGINFDSGASAGSMYSVSSGNGNHPVNFVTWYDAARFANWLNNGQPISLTEPTATSNATEDGAYTLLGFLPTPINGLTVTRNPGATIFLPSENEWYKAAFYNHADGTYFNLPTSSNTEPAATGPTAAPNSANFGLAVGGLTDVGAYTGTTSPYLAFDMGGDVFQWDETLIDPTSRGLRGDPFNFSGADMTRTGRVNADPGADDKGVGFRVASVSSVPEPSTGVLTLLACGLMAWRRKRLK